MSIEQTAWHEIGWQALLELRQVFMFLLFLIVTRSHFVFVWLVNGVGNAEYVGQ